MDIPVMTKLHRRLYGMPYWVSPELRNLCCAVPFPCTSRTSTAALSSTQQHCVRPSTALTDHQSSQAPSPLSRPSCRT